MAGLGKFNFRGKDILEDINAFQSPNDDLAKLFVDHKGPIILKWHNLNYRPSNFAINHPHMMS
jgi:hypothetical protein